MAKEPLQHVIFLGAGASKSSGYPIGDSLRLRLSCRKRFQNELATSSGVDAKESERICSKHFENFGKSIELFRNGGFSTVDEFCKLASEKHPNQAQEMKTLMRLALAFHNPEDKFDESDYYSFIQHLFRGDDLHELKSHITVISYNYDCYLDYLLLRAFTHRRGLMDTQHVEKFYQNKLTSGFYHKDDTTWDQTCGFNYFKLHGSITNNPIFHHPQFFEVTAQERLKMLEDEYHKKTPPPIVFPWELFDNLGKFIAEDEFIFVKKVPPQNESEGKQLYRLYRTIWKNAKWAVTHAKKISFVGLSAHPYMEDGMKYLFDGKQDTVQVVVANPENTHFKDSKNRLHPASLCGRVCKMLQKVAPSMKYIKSFSEDDGMINMKDYEEVKANDWQPDVTPRYTFKEFIQTEMD